VRSGKVPCRVVSDSPAELSEFCASVRTFVDKSKVDVAAFDQWLGRRRRRLEAHFAHVDSVLAHVQGYLDAHYGELRWAESGRSLRDEHVTALDAPTGLSDADGDSRPASNSGGRV
jgi:hypothetical protein